MYIRVGDN